MSYIKNLYAETEQILKRDGYTFNDIDSVQGYDARISVGHFIELAKSTDYDPQDGESNDHAVAGDLMLLMKDKTWYIRQNEIGYGLSEHEHKTDEYWEHCGRPRMIKKISDESVTTLTPKFNKNLGNK